MKRKFFIFCLLMSMFLFQVVSGNCFGNDSNEAFSYEENQNLTLNSLESVYFGKNEILLNIHGIFHNITSINRDLNGCWQVAYEQVVYCGAGHVACRNCRQCHISSCRYYVRPCGLWNR